MPVQFVVLWTDALFYLLILLVIGAFLWTLPRQHLLNAWKTVFQSKVGMATFIILFLYFSVAFLDSIHFRTRLPGSNTHYSSQVFSVLDTLLAPLGDQPEETYSAPFATHLFSKKIIFLGHDTQIQSFPSLKYGGAHLAAQQQERSDIVYHLLIGIFYGWIAWVFLVILLTLLLMRIYQSTFKNIVLMIWRKKTKVPWRTALTMLLLICLLIAAATQLATLYHVLGTDKIGEDVFYQAIKSIRTGLLIGTLTTLIMLPFAVLLGTYAGYFGGWIDDTIQYIYTTLSSIPAVLLIAAMILSLQIYITNHPDLFATITSRADIRLLALCVILGITSWTSLCRLLRGETLKIREMDFIQAARVLNLSDFQIILKHVLPNVMHIVLISTVIDFSGLVLAEAVLSYVGVGVDPSTLSWGNMINAARLELAREPLVWWPLFAAFIFMFVLVLSANLFADKVRDAFDPRLHSIDSL